MVADYSLLGSWDYLDIFEAPDNETATTIARRVRSFGHATTETRIATSWDRFLNVARGLKQRMALVRRHGRDWVRGAPAVSARPSHRGATVRRSPDG